MATNELSRGDPDKFDLTTPSCTWSAVSHTWDHAPTSERIVEDINRVFNVIEEVTLGRVPSSPHKPHPSPLPTPLYTPCPCLII